MASGNIETVIMAALSAIFTAELITAYGLIDPLRLRRLIASPLQDDPTAAAPYLVYGPDYAHGRTFSEENLAEVGGDLLWSTPFRAVIGTPRAKDRDTAYGYIAELSNRVEHTVLRHYDLANISGVSTGSSLHSADGNEWVDAMDPSRMWGATRSRIYGGDGEFYGEAVLSWQYNYFRRAPWLF